MQQTLKHCPISQMVQNYFNQFKLHFPISACKPQTGLYFFLSSCQTKIMHICVTKVQ